MTDQASGAAGAGGGGEQHRLFFALLPDEAARASMSRAAAWLQSSHQPIGRWIAPAEFHVTLRFLGEDSRLNEALVERAMSAADAVRMDAFDLVFDSASSFHGARPPWVLRCREPSEPLHRLWHLLDRALAAQGVRSDSGLDFVPHVTVLRHADKPLPACAIDPIAWSVRDFALMHSQPGKPRRYVEIGRWPLSTGGWPALQPGFAGA